MLACAPAILHAQNVDVPNASFESPTPPPGFPATPQIDFWLKTPEPPGVPLPGGITWDQLSGVFPNTAPGMPDHIDNVQGNQAAYIFAIPGVGIFQNLNATFEAGKAYNLRVGILGGGGIEEGSSFQLSLFYLNSANDQVTLGATPIVYTEAGFPTATHLLDYDLEVPEVQPGDDWSGKNIGVQLLSTFGTGAGYWDLDNVRLTVVPEPAAIALFGLGLAIILVFHLRAGRRDLKVDHARRTR